MRGVEFVGILLIALLPVLAVFGVFGPDRRSVVATSAGIGIEVDYPSRLRFENLERLQILVTNNTAAPRDITLEIDPAYLEAYSGLLFTPAPDERYVFRIVGLPSGESRVVSAELSAHEYGKHSGSVRFASADARGQVEIETLIFP